MSFARRIEKTIICPGFRAFCRIAGVAPETARRGAAPLRRDRGLTHDPTCRDWTTPRFSGAIGAKHEATFNRNRRRYYSRINRSEMTCDECGESIAAGEGLTTCRNCDPTEGFDR